MTESLLVVLAALALVCVSSARLGLALCVVAGFLMDPVRKVTPDQPIWMTGVVAMLLAAVAVGIWARAESRPVADVRRSFPSLSAPIAVGLLWVAVEAARGFVLTGSPGVVSIGVAAYVVPVVAFYVGYAVLSRVGDVERFVTGYTIVTAGMLSAALLARLGVHHPILDQVGIGLIIHAEGRVIPAQGGLFRGLEMAGWHAAAAACTFLAVRASAHARTSLRVAVPLLVLLGYGLLLTARRKYMVQIALFFVLWAVLGWLLRRSRRTGAWIAVLVIGLGLAFATLDADRTTTSRTPADPGMRRLGHLEADSARVGYLTSTALSDIYAKNGFLGSGAGTGSQGSQYFGTAGNRFVGFAAEGGLGKVLAELGVPGLVLLAWFVVAFARASIAAVSRLAVTRPDATDVVTGLVAFLASNIAVYAIAHQVFGDPFVLTMLGLLAGGALRLADDASVPEDGSLPTDAAP